MIHCFSVYLWRQLYHGYIKHLSLFYSFIHSAQYNLPFMSYYHLELDIMGAQYKMYVGIWFIKYSFWCSPEQMTKYTIHSLLSTHKVHYTQFTVYTKYIIHSLLCTQSTLYTVYYVHKVHYTQFTMYTKFTIHSLLYTQSSLYNSNTVLQSRNSSGIIPCET